MERMPRPHTEFLFITALALACGLEGPARPTIDSISLSASATGPLTSLGDTIRLTASAHSDGLHIPGVLFVFTSSNPAVATITEAGLVTALGNGTATIRIAAPGKEATFPVKVAQVAKQVTVTPASIRVPPGETPLFHAVASDARGNAIAPGGPAVVWSTTDPVRTTIGADGRAVLGGRTGGTVVRAVATIGSLSSTTGGLMAVDPDALYVETVAVSVTGGPTFTSLNDFKVAVPSGSNPRFGDVSSDVRFRFSCTWSNSAPDVVYLDQFQRLTAYRNGTSTVTATCNGVSGSVEVTVAQ
jgi:hypothetical protein